MANTKSALKRAKQNQNRRERNIHYKSLLRGRVRAVREAVESGDLAKAEAVLREATSAIHKVAGKGSVHRRAADRSISRLARRVNGLKAQA